MESRRAAFLEGQVRPFRPEMTYTLLGVMAGMYVLELLVLAFYPGMFTWTFAVATDWFVRPWTLITSTLSHDPFRLSHILFNSLFFFFLGPGLERFLGWRRFLVLFLGAGALSGVVQVYLEEMVSGNSAGAFGASGAIMMLFGLNVVLTPRATVLYGFLIPIPMWVMGILFVLLDLAGAANPTDSIGSFAHLSGLAMGAGYGFYLRVSLRRAGLRIQPS